MKEHSKLTEAIRKYSRIPLFTLFVVSLCCSLYLVDAYDAVDVEHDDVCLKAHGIIRLNEGKLEEFSSAILIFLNRKTHWQKQGRDIIDITYESADLRPIKTSSLNLNLHCPWLLSRHEISCYLNVSISRNEMVSLFAITLTYLFRLTLTLILALIMT